MTADISRPQGRIDAHQHYWQIGRFAYSWLTPALSVIYRDFLPPDVLPQMEAAGIQRSVVIQADSSIAEITWLLELAEKYPTITGIVGWVDLAAPELGETLLEFRKYPCFKGVRPNRPDSEQAIASILPGLKQLARLGLTCDLLCSPQNLRMVEKLVTQAPDIQFVIDHLAGWTVVPGGAAAWKNALSPLASQPNVSLKVSGYVAYARPKPPLPETLRPYIEASLELFGADRLLFGSDWPVCTMGGAYAKTATLIQHCISSLSASEQAAIWGGNAARIYAIT
jgi:L-fuconolactonase